MLVSDAMNRAVVTVEPDDLVETAAALVLATGAEHLLVVDEGTLVGIVCACDLRAPGAGERVSDRMTLPVLTVRPDTSLEEVAETIEECAVGCVPVAVGGLILGTVSNDELARFGLATPHPHRHCHVHRAHHRSEGGHAPG